MRVYFTKMHGLGNDFMVIDGQPARRARARADPRAGRPPLRHRLRPAAAGRAAARPGRRLPLPHLQCRRRRGRAMRQRRALLRALRARQGPDRQAPRSASRRAAASIELRRGRRRAGHGRHGRAALRARRRFRSQPRPTALAYALDVDGRTASRSLCCRWAIRTRCCVWTTSTAPRWHRSAPAIESHPRFPQRVNAGFMQVVDRARHPPARLRARRRRDAGLRHRRLRRGGRGHSPGLARQPGRRPPARRSPVIEWAGGGQPR